MTAMELGIIFLMLVLCVTIVMVARHFEKQAFNNCYCTECNEKLRHFDDDSQGGRGYVCDKCGNIVWVSYKVDKI